METKELHFGILGCGGAAKYHAAAIRATEGAELACACGSTAESTERFSREQGCRAAAGFGEMLADPELDVITLCTPSGLHAEEALAVLRAGKHLLIEKPIAIQPQDADRILTAAEASDKTVGVISQMRFSDAAQEIHTAIRAGALGKPVSAALTMRYERSQTYYDSGTWRGTLAMDGGGILMNQGIHGIDLLTFLMGSVEEVCGCTATRLRKIEVEDTAGAVLRFASGAIGTIHATVCNPGGAPLRIEICGENGSVTLEDEDITFWGLDCPCSIPIGKRNTSSAAASPTGISTENHSRQFAEFVAAVQSGRQPAVGVRDGRHALQVVCGIYDSARDGRPVKLDI